MKRVLALFLAAVSFLLPAGASATGQAAERLIVGCDTMSLYALPLMKADSTVLARLSIQALKRLPPQKSSEDM